MLLWCCLNSTVTRQTRQYLSLERASRAMMFPLHSFLASVVVLFGELLLLLLPGLTASLRMLLSSCTSCESAPTVAALPPKYFSLLSLLLIL